MSQAQVGTALGLSASQVSRIESGKRGLSIEQLGPWARALGVRADLMLWQPDEHPRVASEPHAFEDTEATALMRRVATAIPSMSPRARAALRMVLELWQEDQDDMPLGYAEPTTFN